MTQVRPSPQSFDLPPTGSDRRSVMRYGLEADAVFRWTDASGQVHEGRGETRDLSPRGAFITSPVPPPQGVSLTLVVQLPSVGASVREVRIEMQARIVRIEPGDKHNKNSGFAIRNRWMRYVPVE